MKSKPYTKIITNVFIMSIIVCCLSCNRYRKLHVPEKPFIIIEIQALEKGISNYVYRYKTIDKNGYVFYIEELTTYKGSPKKMLGDTIK